MGERSQRLQLRGACGQIRTFSHTETDLSFLILFCLTVHPFLSPSFPNPPPSLSYLCTFSLYPSQSCLITNPEIRNLCLQWPCSLSSCIRPFIHLYLSCFVVLQAFCMLPAGISCFIKQVNKCCYIAPRVLAALGLTDWSPKFYRPGSKWNSFSYGLIQIKVNPEADWSTFH